LIWIDVLTFPFSKENISAVHVDCLLRMKNILYHVVQRIIKTDGSILIDVFKEAHSVSFENFYLVMFYGNQII
jgi:hypothetical protein